MKTKPLFYYGLAGLTLFEFLNVYFIMPFPGSQHMNSLDLAYFLYSNRWVFRVLFGLMTTVGIISVFSRPRKWIPGLTFLFSVLVIGWINIVMTAEKMFRQPRILTFASSETNMLDDSCIVIGVAFHGQVKAYPIRFLSYHHQVQDTVGGKPMIITYCNVCRSGRVYEPVIRGYHEKFRLVGMNHFNAMFEDATTKSWWRQATGTAVTGSLKGEQLHELVSMQHTLHELFRLYPEAQVMQADPNYIAKYDTLGRFEQGKSLKPLTYTDSISWKDKSWIIGIQSGSDYKAYDWNRLKEVKIINDNIGEKSVMIVLASDGHSFAAFERASEQEHFNIINDTLYAGNQSYDLSGRNLTDPSRTLKRINAYQEFWHSWKTFHPGTLRYQ